MATPRDPRRAELSPGKIADNLKEEGKERLERGKASAADQVDHVASAIKSAGDEFGQESTVGTYANQFAGSIGRFSRRLRDSSIEDLASDVQAAARRNPPVFILGGLALGVVLARLMKASTPSEADEDTDSDDFDELSLGESNAASDEARERGEGARPSAATFDAASDERDAGPNVSASSPQSSGV